MHPTQAKVIDAEPTLPPGVSKQDVLARAEEEAEERREQNRLAEDSFEDAVEEAEEAHRDVVAEAEDAGGQR